MASARELLEQADQLMRRNRSGGADIPLLTEVVVEAPRRAEAAEDVPVLTDVVEAGDDAVPEPVASAGERSAAEPVPIEAAAAVADEVVITRSVESIPVDLPMEGDASDWLVMDTIDPATHSMTGVAPDTLATVPPVTLRADEPAPTPTPAQPPWAADTGPVPPPARLAEEPATRDDRAEADAEAARGAKAAAEDERWRSLAEQVSMQVLQRVDLFTDSGLKTQLAEHLKPVVERASAELIDAITDHVGGLLRSYVAEAIEREIAAWRREH